MKAFIRSASASVAFIVSVIVAFHPAPAAATPLHLGACPDAVTNGGFENGWSPWTSSGSATLSTTYAHGGTYSARDGGYYSTGSFSHQATIPSDATSATLTVWLRMDYNGEEMTDNDYFCLEIRDGSGNQLLTLLELCELDAPDYDGWKEMSWDLVEEFNGAYGEMYTGPIQMYFHSQCQGSGYYTYWYIDDVSLEICPSDPTPTPTDTPAPTVTPTPGISCYEALTNGGFSDYWTGWVHHPLAEVGLVEPESEDIGVILDSGSEPKYVYQQIALPSNMTGAMLHSCVMMVTTFGDECCDFKMEIRDAGGNILQTVLSLTNQSIEYEYWHYDSIPLSAAYAGTTIRVYFEALEGLQTTWYVTSVGLEVCVLGATPTPSPTPTATPTVPPHAVVINQASPFSVTGGGLGEYVELYNTTETPVNLAGWQLNVYQNDYTFTSSDTIPANGFFLIADTDPVGGVTPDVYTNINITDNGVNSFAQLLDASSQVVDTVGWADSSLYEGAKLGTLSDGKAWIRNATGIDTDDNSADFSEAYCNPRNSHSGMPTPTPTATPVTIYVDDDNTSGPWDGSPEHPYQTIQNGIDNAQTGEIVFVHSGYYTSDLPLCHQATVLMKEGITVRGEDIATTVIDRGVGSLNGATPNDRRTVIFWSAEGAVMENVTIRGFDGVKFGNAGDQVDDASSTLRNCVLEVNNTAVYVHSYTHPLIQNNTITAPANYGIECWGHSYPTIQNNIITTARGIAVWDDAHPSILYNNCYCCTQNYQGKVTPGQGDIQADPLFVSTAGGDYHLQSISPCIDAGDPSLSDADGTRSDMGAFPYQAQPALTPTPADTPEVPPTPTPCVTPGTAPTPSPAVISPEEAPTPPPISSPAPPAPWYGTGLSLRVLTEEAYLRGGDAAADTKIMMDSGTNLILQWKIEPGIPMTSGDIIAGVILPDGAVMASSDRMRHLRQFRDIARTERIARGISLDTRQGGIMRLSANRAADKGIYQLVAAVLVPGSNAVVQVALSNPFEIY